VAQLAAEGATSRDDVWAAIAKVHGWDGGSARAAIDPDRTVEGARAAIERILDVAADGGRIAAATARPASLFPLVRGFLAVAAQTGAAVISCGAVPVAGPPRAPRALWWLEGVAVVTDGEALLAEDSASVGEDWLFAVGRPDLLVADHGFALAGLAAGCETVAFGGLETPALALAVAQGAPIHLVPVHDACPPVAYEPLVALATEVVSRRKVPEEAHSPHSTTRVPGPYAPPQSGGEG
jgi:hypothetical protein